MEEVQRNTTRLEQLAQDSEAHRYATHALVLRMQKLPVQAIEKLDRAIALCPSDSYLYWQRAYVLDELGHTQRAIEDCDSSLRIDQDFVEARLLKGYCLIKLPKFAEASRELEKALHARPDDTFGLYNLAVAYGGLRDKDRVLNLLTRLRAYPQVEIFFEDARRCSLFAFLSEDLQFRELVATRPGEGESPQGGERDAG